MPQPVESIEKKPRVDLKSVMDRVNVFLRDEKKFKKSCLIYQKILLENKSNQEGGDDLFSGIRTIVLSVKVMMTSENGDLLNKLFETLQEVSCTLSDFHIMWINRWKDLLSVLRRMTSDDSFEISSVHKTLDSFILLWNKKREVSVEETESEVLLGNLQLYVMEILMRLLSLAVLEYRLTPVIKSCSLLINEYEYVFEANKEIYELFYKQYKEKKNKTSQLRIVKHFTEEDSRNRVHPMRLKGSNPYLL